MSAPTVSALDAGLRPLDSRVRGNDDGGLLDSRVRGNDVRRGNDVPTRDQNWERAVIAIAIISSAALLIVQQVSFRLLSPLIGSSVETWSAIIGVFLLGIAIGNHVAGKLADQMSPRVLILVGLMTGALSVAAMPMLADQLSTSPTFLALPLWMQIFTAATIVCLVPGALLSLVTPPSIRSVVRQQSDVGSAAGRIFAWGTFGSLAGNYLAGFVLLAWLGVRAIVWLTVGGLAVTALGTAVLIARRVLSERASRQRCDEVPSPDSEPESAAAECEDHDSDAAINFRNAAIIVICCSFVTGALEGAAFRILAPLVGVSIFLSAGVVGVVLTGMSLGNALGGRLATRFGTRVVLRRSLLISAGLALAVAPCWKVVVSSAIYKELPLIPQIIAWSFTLFFLPALAFGTITPQVIRLCVVNVRQTGTVSGRLYAWSTVGCIAGILAAAWLMIESFGAVRTTLICGLMPLALVWLTGARSSAVALDSRVRGNDGMRGNDESRDAARRSATVPLALAVAGVALLLVCKSPYDRESRYFSLAVAEDFLDGRDVSVLVLDRLVHSAIDLDDPSFLHYPHERIQGDFTRAAAIEARQRGEAPRVLVIGGGGYSFPRWVESQSDLNDVQIDVVEIDPAVTEIAHDLLGLSRATRIRSIHMDGRQFVKSAPAASYDLVIQDAVNDFSVPSHLMTAEYNRLIGRLVRPNGVYLLTVIDSIESGTFLSSAVRTMQAGFPQTRLLAPPETHRNPERAVFVIGGRPNADRHGELMNDDSAPIDDTNDWWLRRSTAHVFDDDVVENMLDRNSNSPVLTDDYAPVDRLMTGHFLNRAQ